MKKYLFLLVFPVCLRARTLPDTIQQKIDQVFKSYTSKTPGCAIAIIQNGALVFQKGYGMANLEYSIPVSPNTIFHIASESKQYVAFCILLLEKQGKLSVDDDVRKYLDFVPDFGYKITIRHLILHTSGLRDQWQLLANAGWQLDDVITQEHVLKLIAQQKALNFPPGEEFLYCNTGYTLLAEIVKKVSGLSLRQFVDQNIFKPLGMENSHFNDDYREIVPNRAYSYFPKGNGFQNAILSYSIVGATSLLTTVLDEVKWLDNLETGKVGGKELVEKMKETGNLNDGRKLNYAYALTIDKFKGWEQIGHGGGDAGFRTYACRIPEKKLGLVVFSNSSIADPGYLVRQVAGILITDSKEEPKSVSNLRYADSTLLKKLQGSYYSERGNTGKLIWENGKLQARNFFLPSPNNIKLSILTTNRYALDEKGPFLIVDEKNASADPVMEMKIENPNNIILYMRQPKTAQVITAEFSGRYYCPETEAFYIITEKDGVLSLEHRKFSTVTLKYIAPDQFTCSNWWMDHIRFLRDTNGKITAFEVNSGRIQHLRYNKLDPGKFD
jgi:CubicO group peptidase (beta-lactamase class C family)